MLSQSLDLLRASDYPETFPVVREGSYWKGISWAPPGEVLIILAPSRLFPPKLAEQETHLQRGAKGGIHPVSPPAPLDLILSRVPPLAGVRAGYVSLGIGFIRGMWLIIPRRN